jgi:archaellum component FlaC
MFITFGKNDVSESFRKRLEDVESTIVQLKSRVSALEIEQNTLRDKVLRKIQKQDTLQTRKFCV